MRGLRKIRPEERNYYVFEFYQFDIKQIVLLIPSEVPPPFKRI